MYYHPNRTDLSLSQVRQTLNLVIYRLYICPTAFSLLRKNGQSLQPAGRPSTSYCYPHQETPWRGSNLCQVLIDNFKITG